jgi:hypothetical protein
LWRISGCETLLDHNVELEPFGPLAARVYHEPVV